MIRRNTLMTKLVPISVSSLKGSALDWAVAECLDIKIFQFLDNDLYFQTMTPSTNWSQGGPIIDREKIDVNFSTEDNSWIAGLKLFDEQCDQMYKGPTPLIAAMRCYVASKLGDIIEIPEELI